MNTREIDQSTSEWRWRAEAVMRQLWRVAHQQASWTSLHDSHATPSDAPRGGPSRGGVYLQVAVPPLPELAIATHSLRLWRTSLEEVLREADPSEQASLRAFFAKTRYSAVFAYERRDRYVRRGWVDVEVAQIALALAAVAEPVATRAETA